MADLIPYTTEQILDLFKSAYYEQTGNPLLIGSDEFAFSTVASYILRVFEQAMKRGADAVSINTATGDALDDIAASFGIARPEATPARMAIALENETQSPIVCDIGQIVAHTNQGVTFTNTAPITLATNGHTFYVFLYCSEAGSKYNGITPSEMDIPDGSLLVASSISTGGTDSLQEHTQANDEAFRKYLLEGIKALAVGTAPYYEYEARKGYDGVLADVYCLRDGDTGFEPGKVKIKTLFLPSITSTVYKNTTNETIREYLSSDSVKCVTDFVSVAEAESEYQQLLGIVLYYESRFQTLNEDGITIAQDHFHRVFEEYYTDLITHLGKPFIEAEFEAMLCKPDENGIYATTFQCSTGYRKPANGKKLIISATWASATVNWI